MVTGGSTDSGDLSPAPTRSTRSSIIIGKQPQSGANPNVEHWKATENKFGWGRFTPNCLQCLNRPGVLLFCLSLLLTTQGMLVSGILPASITHLERRFHFSSAEIGALFSVYDVGVTVMLLPISHYGSHGHKGRWIGFGAVLTGIASIICILPHFFAEPYQYGMRATEQSCNRTDDGSLTDSECDSTSMGKWKVSFYFGELLFGIAASPQYTIAIAYLDENVSQHMSSTYIGIYSASVIVGPCLGYVLAALLADIYGYPHVNPADLPMKSTEDPRWYGAWWMGMLGGGVVSCILAIPILGFSRELPRKTKARAADGEEYHQPASTSFQLSVSLNDWDNFKFNLQSVLHNPTYVSLIIEQVATVFIVGSFANFSTKYLETQFSMTTAKASFAAAGTAIPTALLGTVIGTFLQRRFKLRCKGNIILAIVGTVIATAFCAIFFVTCPTRAFAGVTAFDDSTDTCSASCSCKSYRYEPHCWTTENVSFFSKCHADEFANCSRIEDTELVENLCASNCQTYDNIWFLVGFGMLVLFVSLKKNPVQQAILRCVPYQLRTFALALGWIPLRLIGTIPANPLIGFVISSACIKWQERCGVKEVCVLYDNQALASLMQLTGAIGFFVAYVALIVAWRTYVRLPSGEWYKGSSDHSTLEEALRSTWKEPVVEP